MRIQLSKSEKTILFVIAIILLILFFAIMLVISAVTPLNQARAQATQIAENYAHITQVTDFYAFTREATYYTIAGINAQNEHLFVIVPAKEGDVTVLHADEGLSEAAARQIVLTQAAGLEIQSTTIGKFHDRPVWEVVGRNSAGVLFFYLVDWQSGEVVSMISTSDTLVNID